MKGNVIATEAPQARSGATFCLFLLSPRNKGWFDSAPKQRVLRSP
jgi:hypothetical protein